MLKNIGWMTIATLLRLGAGFVLFIFLARELGPANFGLLAYWLAFASLLALIVNYGFGLQLLRELGRNRDAASTVIGATVSAKLVLTVIVVVAGAAIGFQENGRPEIFWPLLGMALAESFAEHLNYILRALGLFDKEARFALATTAINFLGVLIPLFVFKTLTAVALGFLVSRVVSLMVNWQLSAPFLPKLKQPLDFSIRAIRTTLSDGFPYAADMAVSTLNSTLDVLLLSYMAGPKAVGVYQAGLKLTQGANSIAPIVGNVYIPHIASKQAQKIDCRREAASLILKMAVLGGGMGAVLALGNNLITTLLFGTDYLELAVLLPWFGLALCLRFVAAGFGINLTAHGMQSVRVVTNVFAVIVLLTVAMITVPVFGAVGMLMAFVASTSLVGSAYFSALIWKKIPIGINFLNLVVIGIFIISIVSQISGTR